MSGGQSEVDGAVRSRFSVRESFLLPDGEYEYRVECGSDPRGKFMDLSNALTPMGLTPWLTGTPDDGVITVRKTLSRVMPKSRIPIVAVLLSALTIVLFSLLEQEGDQQLAPSISGYAAFFGFGVAVAAVVGSRYLGHRYAAKRTGEQPNDSYLIPGLPGITASLPTLGFVTYQREPALNRDRYFDMVILGPLLALGAAVILQVAWDLTAVQSTSQLTTCQSVNALVSVCPVNPSVIQIVIDYLLGPLLPAVGAGQGLVSPLGDAPTVGFLLFFISILPMASFDGGHLSNVLWGTGRARITTYLCVALLLALDTNQLLYWGVAFAVLLVGGRPLKLSFRDGISAVSKRRLFLYLALLLVAFLVIPLPQDMATIPLG